MFFGYPSSEEMKKLQKEINEVFSGFVPTANIAGGQYPQFNVWSKDDKLVLISEIPGISPEELDITVTDDILVIKSTPKPEESKEKITYHRRERNEKKFCRTLKLPFRVNSQSVVAEYNKGVLKLTMQQSEQDKPRKIAIKIN